MCNDIKLVLVVFKAMKLLKKLIIVSLEPEFFAKITRMAKIDI